MAFFIEFCEAKFLWASRFAHLRLRSRRAIRSITRQSAKHEGGWFRFYPSRCCGVPPQMKNEE